MRRSHRGLLATLWFYIKLCLLLLVGLVVIAVYLVVIDDDDITIQVRVPRDIVPVDLDLTSQENELEYPRERMKHRDVIVLMEDLAVLRLRT